MGRTVATYSHTAQGFDEPCHIAAAIEWLDLHTYTLDPVHPPLARIAIGLPLFLAGERYPKLPIGQLAFPDYNVVGNAVIYGDNHYQRNLALARSGILPFLVLAIVLVFLWARSEFGDFAGIIAAALFSTLPTILAFSGMAYTDMPAACMQFAAFFAFTKWLRKPSTGASVLMGLALGLAVLCKLTTMLFFPAAVVSILIAKWISGRRREVSASSQIKWIARITVAFAVTIIVVWAGYGFQIGHVRESMQVFPENMPSFQHLPAPFRGIARTMVLDDWTLPAPALLKGVATAWTLNKSAPPSYLFGRIRNGGWWYFFLVTLAVKTPIPFLVLSVMGILATLRRGGHEPWTALAPAACIIGVLLVTLGVSYDVGLRHILVALPLLSVVAGGAAAQLWERKHRLRPLARIALGGALLCQVTSCLGASSDPIAYFNRLAGNDPSKVLVTGCDLDCGQDVYRLADALRQHKVSHASIAVWSSGEMSQVGMPEFSVPQPFQPVTGWVALSARSMRMGDVFHSSYPPGAFDWLKSYQPVELVGKTISLYYIPATEDSSR